MKRIGRIVVLILFLSILSSCAFESVFSSVDPFADISLFDDTEADVAKLLGSPTEIDSSDYEYNDFSYLGMTGELYVGFKNDNSIEEMGFVFKYPSADHSKNNSSFSPTFEDLRIAQENWDKIVQHYMKLYGEPVLQNSEKVVWIKERRMDRVEIVQIERRKNKKAFDVYSTVTWD